MHAVEILLVLAGLEKIMNGHCILFDLPAKGRYSAEGIAILWPKCTAEILLPAPDSKLMQSAFSQALATTHAVEDFNVHREHVRREPTHVCNLIA